MSVQFRSRIKSAIDYSNELNSYGVCCGITGSSTVKSFYECFTEGGHFIPGSTLSVTCPDIDTELGCCCSCSYVQSGGFESMESYPPQNPYLGSGTKSNVSKCECSRLGGKWTAGSCPSLTSDNLDALCIQEVNENQIDVRYPRACCHLGFDPNTGWPTEVTCTDVCNSSDCAALSTPEYPSYFDANTRCNTPLLSSQINTATCNTNPLLLMATSSKLYDGMNLSIGSCYTLSENSEGDFEYDCTLSPEILCNEYWVEAQDSDETYCDNKFAPSNPVKINGKYSVQTITEANFNALGLTPGDQYQGGVYIGIFQPSKLNTTSSEVYGNLDFGDAQLGTFTSDDVGGTNSKWAIIVDETLYEVPFLLNEEVDLHYNTSLWDGYYNTYGYDNLFSGIESNLMNTIKYTNRKGFIDYYLPSIYELYFYSAYLNNKGSYSKGNIISSSIFDTKYTNIGTSKNKINEKSFVYGQIINSKSSYNYKTGLIDKYNKQTALFFRRIVIQ